MPDRYILVLILFVSFFSVILLRVIGIVMKNNITHWLAGKANDLLQPYHVTPLSHSPGAGTCQLVEKELIKILNLQFDYNPDEINMDTNLKYDLGMDSMELMEFILICEKTFNITLEEDDITCVQTLGSVAHLIRSKVPVS